MGKIRELQERKKRTESGGVGVFSCLNFPGSHGSQPEVREWQSKALKPKRVMCPRRYSGS